MTTKRMLLELLKRLARARQYELIPAWMSESQPLVRHLRKLFAIHSVDCVFDVGGNLGQYHDLLRDEVRFDGWIFSFEPVGRYVEVLREKSLADSKWRVFDFALGSSNDVATINVTKSPGLNSFLEPRVDAVQGYWADDAVSGAEQARIRVLDEVFQELSDTHRVEAPYLKLDTQGFDLEVLKGAGRSLNQFRALQTEGSVKPLYKGMPHYRDVVEYLNEAGFELSGMFPVGHDQALRLIEFDCLMVNNRFA